MALLLRMVTKTYQFSITDDPKKSITHAMVDFGQQADNQNLKLYGESNTTAALNWQDAKIVDVTVRALVEESAPAEPPAKVPIKKKASEKVQR